MIHGTLHVGNCNDGLLNQDETQVDCGGVCSRKCGKFSN